MLRDVSPTERKQMLGERLFLLVQQIEPTLAAKITGMFLEWDSKYILMLIASPPILATKVRWIWSVTEILSWRFSRALFRSKKQDMSYKHMHKSNNMSLNHNSCPSLEDFRFIVFTSHFLRQDCSKRYCTTAIYFIINLSSIQKWNEGPKYMSYHT